MRKMVDMKGIFWIGEMMENESENSPSLRQQGFFEDFEWRDQRGGFLKDKGHGKTSRTHIFAKICFLKAKIYVLAIFEYVKIMDG